MTAYKSEGIVRLSETDASGRFHYASALMWAENTEHQLYRSLSLPASSFPRRAVNATFERPLEEGDEYAVELGVERLGSTSITYTWRVLSGAEVAVTGSHTVVHVGDAGRPSPLPPPLREVLEPLSAPEPV